MSTRKTQETKLQKAVDAVGVEQAPEQEPIEVIVKENPLLKKIQLPGQRFRLPSKGMFYKNGELAKTVESGEVEVYPMKTIDEINLKSPDMIFQGTAIERVFLRCIPDIIKPSRLISKDVDYLMACLRRVTYGGNLPIRCTCPCTDNKLKRDYDVPLDYLITTNTEEITEESINTEYSMQLETNKITGEFQDIQFKPLIFEDLVKIYQYKATEIDHLDELALLDDAFDLDGKVEEDIDEYVSLSISSVVESVDGYDNNELIKDWAKNLPVSLKDEVADKISNITDWGTKFEYTVACKDCGEDIDISASLNPVGFFMLPSSQTKND